MKILFKIAVAMFAIGLIGAAIVAWNLYYSDDDMPLVIKVIISFIILPAIITIVALAIEAIRDINSYKKQESNKQF